MWCLLFIFFSNLSVTFFDYFLFDFYTRIIIIIIYIYISKRLIESKYFLYSNYRFHIPFDIRLKGFLYIKYDFKILLCRSYFMFQINLFLNKWTFMHAYCIRGYASCMKQLRAVYHTVYQITLTVYQHLGQISISSLLPLLVINQYSISWSSLPSSNTFAQLSSLNREWNHKSNFSFPSLYSRSIYHENETRVKNCSSCLDVEKLVRDREFNFPSG